MEVLLEYVSVAGCGDTLFVEIRTYLHSDRQEGRDLAGDREKSTTLVHFKLQNISLRTSTYLLLYRGYVHDLRNFSQIAHKINKKRCGDFKGTFFEYFSIIKVNLLIVP